MHGLAIPSGTALNRTQTRISRIISGYDGSRKSERETQIKFGILLKSMENVILSTPTKIQDNDYQNRRENNVFML